jgi:NADH-ubiquinone oxidoreductase chain 5
MFFICGCSNYNIALFHLFNHAFFKALLFLGMGSIIHSMFDEQDFRKMGGLINLLPFSYIIIFIGIFSLIGFPFLTGYYSKDIILEFAFSLYTIKSVYFFVLGCCAAFITSLYSIRLLF